MASVTSHSGWSPTKATKPLPLLCVSKTFLFVSAGLLGFACGQTYLYTLAGDLMAWVAPALGGAALVGNVLYIHRLVKRTYKQAEDDVWADVEAIAADAARQQHVR